MRVLLVVIALHGAGGKAFAAEERDAEILVLREEVRLLAAQVRRLEERLSGSASSPAVPAVAANPAPAPAPASTLAVTGRSVTLTSADRANMLRIRGTVQAESRWFFDDGGVDGNDSFSIRRARISLAGTFNRMFQYQIVPEFAGSSGSLINAYVTATFSPAVEIKIGKFKPSVGIEHTQSDPTTPFVERSMASGLMPSFDLGVQVGGAIDQGRLVYTLGLFNSLVDGGNPDPVDGDDAKGLAARVTYEPFPGFEFGMGGTYSPSGGPGTALTSGYRSDARQKIFGYFTATNAEGAAWQWSPQAALFKGPVGVLTEYVVSSVGVRSGNTTERLNHDAWNASVSYLLTGENATNSGVIPNRPFALGDAGWGAFELAVRYTSIDFDDNSFPAYASPLSNVSRVDSVGLGLNWYLSSSVRFTTDYFHSSFDASPAATSVLIRSGENALVTRMQVVF